MARYKNIELDAKLAAVIRHMNAVEEYREVLQNLQTVWDNLTLLGQLPRAWSWRGWMTAMRRKKPTTP